jgi:hypothetical protein
MIKTNVVSVWSFKIVFHCKWFTQWNDLHLYLSEGMFLFQAYIGKLQIVMIYTHM